jgi:hypothetical protein
MNVLKSIFPSKFKGVPNTEEEWCPEKKLDRELCGAGYNFTDSVAVAVDFFFRAKLGKLPEAEQHLVCIDPVSADIRCEYISPSLIRKETSGETRTVYFGTRENPDLMFRVVVCKRADQEWRAVGFHYPRDSKGHYYAVFEPHHYWFGWRDKSLYLSPLVNPDY